MKMQIKRTIAILLAVCFISSVTAMAVTASNFGPKSNWTASQKALYNTGYQAGSKEGDKAGSDDGDAQGQADCNKNAPFTNRERQGNMQPKYGTPYYYGYADGYNTAYQNSFFEGYESGANACMVD
jgi:hypothetical protein